jgi:hypothetical protein
MTTVTGGEATEGRKIGRKLGREAGRKGEKTI